VAEGAGAASGPYDADDLLEGVAVGLVRAHLGPGVAVETADADVEAPPGSRRHDAGDLEAEDLAEKRLALDDRLGAGGGQ
jgi:hypothetical protein